MDMFREQKTSLLKEILRRAEEKQCPVCGYYCLGNGGIGCINKNTSVKDARKELENYEKLIK